MTEATAARPRGLDHIVLAVQDLEAARQFFKSLCFTLTPPARHPFGTGNSLVQLQGNFIELLAVVEPEKLVPMTAESFSFGVHNQCFLERREGLSMLVLTSDDAAADSAAWAARGLRGYEPVFFKRQAERPDGDSAEVSFTIAFAIDPAMPEAAFFVCQQHRPENFWQARYQSHANGAHRLVGVTMVAEEPAAHAGFFEKLVGPDGVRRGARGLEIPLAGGGIEVLTPAALGERFATAAPFVEGSAGATGPAFVAATVAVGDLNYTTSCIDDAGTPATARDGALEIAPDQAFGMLLEFVADS